RRATVNRRFVTGLLFQAVATLVYRFDDATTDRRMRRAHLYASAAIALALFSTAAVAEKLQADAEPVRDIVFIVFMGDLSNPPGNANLTEASVLAYRTRFKG